MGFSEQFLKELSDTSGIGYDELSSANSSTDESALQYRIKEGSTFITNEELERSRGVEYTKGGDFKAKEIAKTLGITLGDGQKKTPELVGRLKEYYMAQLEEQYKNPKPSEELERMTLKSKEWENKYTKIDETYRDTLATIEEIEGRNKQVIERYETEKYNNEILTKLPKDLPFGDNIALMAIKDAISKSVDEDGVVSFKDKQGKVLTNRLAQNLSLQDAINTVVDTEGWLSGNKKKNEDPDAEHKLGLSAHEAMLAVQKENLDPARGEGRRRYLLYQKS